MLANSNEDLETRNTPGSWSKGARKRAPVDPWTFAACAGAGAAAIAVVPVDVRASIRSPGLIIELQKSGLYYLRKGKVDGSVFNDAPINEDVLTTSI